MILTSDLIQLGYDKNPIISQLNKISFQENNTSIEPVYPWASLRDIFEYFTCVEFAKSSLLQLPKGKELGSVHLTPARYDSASLVFFSQATLDNLAVWLNTSFSLGLKGNNVSFYKSQIKPKLASKNDSFGLVLDEYSDFIDKLNLYRMEWLHRLAGGASLYADRPINDPDVEMSIQVPIDPEIPSLISEPKKYLKRIKKVQSQNSGNWLVPIDDFAIYIHENTKTLTLKLIEISLETEF